jgi:hypothetical protein
VSETNAGRLVADLRAFLEFYRPECAVWSIDDDASPTRP